ncbi:MAG: IclR family transcriptional regulator [Actinobacteria bacterium]|nr:IclR family transcriptional regulator [Actinomycetota bacterium]
MARTGTPATRRVASVARALAVLDALAESAVELGTNEIARRTRINASTISRLLATLADAGLVEHVQATGRYRLGLRLVQLGNAVVERLDLRDLARMELEALVAATGETATLSAPGEGVAITIDFVPGPSSVQGVAQIGRPSVAHATATGKVMLAFTEAELPDEPLHAYTARTITAHAALRSELERVRERGWAESLEEREDDLNAIAAPIRNGLGGLAAIIGLQGPAFRFDPPAMSAALAPLREQAEAVSAKLGWLP